MPCRHIPAQLVSFAGYIPRSYHRKLHYLFLEHFIQREKKKPRQTGLFLK
jgi:hypothetical protein